MVAPELRLSDEEIVQCLGFELSQKYKPATDLMELRHLTANFLLFPWRVPGVSFAYIDDEDRWVRNHRLLGDRAGLYISPDGIMTNDVSMQLPFLIRRNGHVLRSDGMKIEKAGHDVLANDWLVDENGDAGGESNWRRI
ncbi:uncharacterized protein EKO05_0006959 [Ascochyta rabiei]|uniref:Uncharacterized protein n=1 Tax=Didymella rabiei TaxID=5454 RepID=A0A162Z5I5_DIDRA|nr:uncharacterized protein EKO05_0006959 [Ascochyta rabiei]KZM20405.1 hypothetical protein ST47_g8475 [Ascochyta rabiei]UPX16565.1 hypothetical protein EKO05_0006959 [Ascochyta rabiei]